MAYLTEIVFTKHWTLAGFLFIDNLVFIEFRLFSQIIKIVYLIKQKLECTECLMTQNISNWFLNK